MPSLCLRMYCTFYSQPIGNPRAFILKTCPIIALTAYADSLSTTYPSMLNRISKAHFNFVFIIHKVLS